MPTDIDVDLLRAFTAAADAGSFTAAARSLNRTQSAVSMQIKRLEETVKARLFDRTGRRVALTRSGEALAGYARRMLALNDEALEQLQEAALDGAVRLGVMEDYATSVLPPILARFAAQHPRVAIELETGLTTPMIGRLGRDFDLVLAMHPAGHARGDVLRREQAVWAASRTHRAYEQPILPLALSLQGCLFRQAALDALDRAGRRWRFAYLSPSHGAVEAAAAAGLAVTVAKTSTFPASLRVLGRAENLPELPSFEIALHRSRRKQPRAAAALADYLAASLRDGTA